jgi:hypothetical protein
MVSALALSDLPGHIRQARDFDPGQPRDDHGRWTDGGASEGTGSVESHAAPARDDGADSRKLANAFRSRGVRGIEGGRHVVRVWELDEDGRKLARSLDITPQTFHELSPAGAGQFHAAISAAKASTKFGASVYVYPEDDYGGMRLFTSADGKSGFALKNDDIVSAFKHPDTKGDNFANAVLPLATKLGGRRLDAFDTVLPNIYSDSGFRAIARTPWDDSQKPPDWDFATYAKHNGGRPDVVFMVYDPAGAKPYKAGDGITVAGYDDGTAAQHAWIERHKAWRALRTKAKATLASLLARTFDESEHPRDAQGRWTDAGGGDETSSKPTASDERAPPPPPEARARGFDTVGYHVTSKDIDRLEQVPSYRGVTFFAPTPEGARAGSTGGAAAGEGFETDTPTSGQPKPKKMLAVYLRSQDIYGLTLTPSEQAWWKAAPDKVGEDEIEEVTKNLPRNFEYWYFVYDEQQRADGSFEYTKRPMPSQTWEEANKTHKDVYGKMLGGYHDEGSKDRSFAERVRSLGMSGWIVADEGGVSIAHADPANSDKVSLASDWRTDERKAEKNRQPSHAKDWDESQHPRDPAGTSTGGQFTSDGGGEAGKGEKFDSAAWRKMGIKEAKEKWSKMSRAEKDAAANAREAIDARVSKITGSAEAPATGNAHKDIEGRVEQLREKVTATSIERLTAFGKDSYDMLNELAGGDPAKQEQVRQLALSMVDHVAAQDFESMGRLLGDHGVHHLDQDARLGLELLQHQGEQNTPENRALMMMAGAYHDAGYLAEPSRAFLDEDHPRWSAQHYQANVAPMVTELYGKEFSDKLATLIVTHANTDLDWNNNPLISTFSTADNMALFHQEKLPPMLREVEENLAPMIALGRGKISVDETKQQMRDNIKSAKMPEPLRQQALAAVDEVMGASPKFMLGMLGTSMDAVGWDQQENHPVFTVRQGRRNAELSKVLDVGQKQFEKFAKTYGADPKQFMDTGSFEYKDSKGRTVLEGRLRRATQKELVEWLAIRARAEATLALLRAFDESQHPREPPGSPEGGQFTSDGDGGSGSSDISAARFASTEGQQRLTSNVIIAEAGDVKPNSKSVETVAQELNARAGAILRQELGVDYIDPENATDESEDYIASVIAQELKDGLHNGHSAHDWYDKTLHEAMAIAEKLYPEIATDPDQRFIYTVALAITSQGETVDSNVRLADQAFESYRKTGAFTTELRTKKTSVATNLAKVNKLIETAGGIGPVREFFNTEMTVKELQAATGHKVSKMGVDDKVYGSAILGPKIGQGFYQNLNGNFKPITMDLWFMRSWGRITNTGIGVAELAPIIERFDNALKAEGKPVPRSEKAKIDLATQIFRQHEKDYKAHRADYESGKREKTELVYASERLSMNHDGVMVEAPRGSTQRNWMTSVFHRALDKLDAQGIKLNPASAQATWWTPEKNLYDKMGVRVREVQTDYAKSLGKLAASRGVAA